MVNDRIKKKKKERKRKNIRKQDYVVSRAFAFRWTQRDEDREPNARVPPREPREKRCELVLTGVRVYLKRETRVANARIKSREPFERAVINGKLIKIEINSTRS